MDRYLEVIDVEPATLAPYLRYINRYIRHQIGALQVGRVDTEVLDSFYGRLRTCRADCRGPSCWSTIAPRWNTSAVL
jgi:integrase